MENDVKGIWLHKRNGVRLEVVTHKHSEESTNDSDSVKLRVDARTLKACVTLSERGVIHWRNLPVLDGMYLAEDVIYSEPVCVCTKKVTEEDMNQEYESVEPGEAEVDECFEVLELKRKCKTFLARRDNGVVVSLPVKHFKFLPSRANGMFVITIDHHHFSDDAAQDALTESFEKQDEFCDFTIKNLNGGEAIKIHRVLFARSSVLKDLMKDRAESGVDAAVFGLNHKLLKAYFRYLYFGRMQLTVDDVIPLSVFLHKFDLCHDKNLEHALALAVERNLTSLSLEMFKQCSREQVPYVWKAVFNWLERNLMRLCQHEGNKLLQHVEEDMLRELLLSEKLVGVKEEIDVYGVVENWLKFHPRMKMYDFCYYLKFYDSSMTEKFEELREADEIPLEVVLRTFEEDTDTYAKSKCVVECSSCYKQNSDPSVSACVMCAKPIGVGVWQYAFFKSRDTSFTLHDYFDLEIDYEDTET